MKLHRHSRKFFAVFSSLWLAKASAAVGSWNVNAAGGWDNASNWSGGTIPNGTGDTAHFSFDISAARAVSLNGDRTVGQLTIGDPTSSFFAYSIASGTPASSRLIFDQTGTSAAFLNFPVVANTAANTISAPILLMDSLEVTTAASNATNPTQTLSGIISDGASSYSITKKGLGLMTLSGVNAFDGGVTIEAGKLTASHNFALGTGAATVSEGAQLFLNGISGAYANALTIAGNGVALATNETDSANLVGALRYANATTSGSMAVSAGGARVGVTTAAGFGIHAGNLTGSGNLQINSSNTNHNGTLILLGDASTYTGTVTVSQGTLRLGSGNLGGSLVVADGSRLHLNNLLGNDQAPSLGTDSGATRSLTLGSTTGATVLWDPSTTAATSVAGNVTLAGTNVIQLSGTHPGGTKTLLSYSGSLTGGMSNLSLPGGMASYRAGTVFSLVPGTPNLIQLTMVSQNLTWTGASNGNWNFADNNWTGTTFVNGDNVTLDDSPAAASPITITLTTNVAPNSISVNNPSKNYTISGSSILTGNASLSKNGAGSLTLSGTTAHTFSGPVALQAGALYVASTAGLGSGNTLELSGGTLASNNTTAVTLARNVILNGSVQLGDSGRTGTLTFNGVHTFANSTMNAFLGTTCNFAGQNTLPTQLTISTPFSGASNASCSFTGSNLMTGNLKLITPAAFNSSNIVNINGTLTDGENAFTLTKEGAGALRLSALNEYDGNTTIKEGTIIAFHFRAFGTGDVIVENSAQAYLSAAGTYANHFQIAGNGQTLNGLSNTSPDGAIHLNASNQFLTGNIVLSDHARIASYFSSSNNIVSGTISETMSEPPSPKNLSLGNPGAANGCGTLTIAGHNTYTGNTTIHRIVLRAHSSSAFGTGDGIVEIGGDGSTTLTTRLEVGPNISLTKPITLRSVGRTDSTNNWGLITGFPGNATTASIATVSGPIDIQALPATGGHFASQGHATDSLLRVMGEVNAFTVPVRVASGIVEFGGGGTYDVMQHLQGTIRLAASQGLSQFAILEQGANGPSVFDLNGYSQMISAITRPTGTNAVSVTNNGAVSSTLTLAPQNQLVNTYPGTFVTGASPLHLVIAGDSVMELSGNSTAFGGTTTVTGHLRVSGTHGSATSGVTTQNGSTLSGKGIIGGNLTMASGSTINVDPSTAGNLSANGNITVSGTVTVNLLQVSSNPIVVMSCTGTMTASPANFVLANAQNYPTATFTVVDKQVILTTQTVNLTWTGNGGSNWDLNTTSNWTDGSTARKFLNGYNSIFTDAPAADQTIGVSSPIAPNALNFTNATRRYQFSDGNGGVIQAGSMTKSGNARVTFDVPLTLTGSMILNAGTVVLRSPDLGQDPWMVNYPVSGSGELLMAAGFLNPISVTSDNATLSGTFTVQSGQVNATQSTFAGSATVVLGNADTLETDLVRLNLASGVIAENSIVASSAAALTEITGVGIFGGNSSLTKMGTGVLELNAAHTYSGATTVVSGTLRLKTANAISSSSTITLGTMASGSNDAVLTLPAGTSANQAVLSSPIILGTAPATSRAVMKKIFGQTVTYQGPLHLNGRNFTVESSGIRFSNSISGNGNLIVNTGDTDTPVIIDSTTNTFTGNLFVESGLLQSSASTGVRDCIPDQSSVILSPGTVFAVAASDTIASLTGGAGSIVRSAGSGAILTVGAGNASFTYDGAIENGAAAFTFAKTGSGTVTLQGNSSHTGTLRILNGTLLLNGSSTARLEISSGAVFGGTGSIQDASVPTGGHIPINGSISPGGTGVGTLTIGNRILMSGAGFHINIADWNSTTPGTGHDLLVCPNVIFGIGVTTVRIDGTGMTNFSESPRSFSFVQANETQFPSGVNFTTFEMVNFPGAGSWRMQGQGNTLQLVYTPAAYAAWATAKGLTESNNGISADPDGDGFTNLQEYYFDGNPLASASSTIPQIDRDAQYAIFRFRRRDDAEAEMSSQIVQYTTGLMAWNSVTIPASSAAADGNGVIVNVTENGTATDDIEVKIPLAIVSDGRVFARVTITK